MSSTKIQNHVWIKILFVGQFWTKYIKWFWKQNMWILDVAVVYAFSIMQSGHKLSKMWNYTNEPELKYVTESGSGGIWGHTL